MNQTLAQRYEGIVCDLDGVVYRGSQAVPYAIEALGAAREQGVRIAYATNNASRPAPDVAEQLTSLGLTLDVRDVVTSSQAGARYLAEHVDAGALVLAVGGEGVALALSEDGLTPCRHADLDDGTYQAGDVAAVLQGLGKDVTWRDFAAAGHAVNAGATWVATNIDSTLPTDQGLAPGNGALVAVVRAAVDHDPVVVGKPQPPLYELSAAVLGTAVPATLAIGDRLDTDIEGAVNTGMDGLYVMTGVSRVADVAQAPASQRPRYLGVDLRVLHRDYTDPAVEVDGARATGRCGDATARLGGGAADLSEGGTADERLRAVVATAWALTDAAAASNDGLDPLEGIRWLDVEAWIEGA